MRLRDSNRSLFTEEADGETPYGCHTGIPKVSLVRPEDAPRFRNVACAESPHSPESNGDGHQVAEKAA
jgi:hypothetical protein